jgi:hypothetical protein
VSDRHSPRYGGPARGWASISLFGVAAIAVIQFYRPPESLFASRVGDLLVDSSGAVAVAPSRTAFGRSGEVRMRFVLPAAALQMPLEVQGDPSTLQYEWLRVETASNVDTTAVEAPRPLEGALFVAPGSPGFYRLALVRSTGERQVMDSITVAVMVPFAQKSGSTLNGYRIGTYLAERLGWHSDRPEGFVEIREAQLDIPVSTHLRVSDFITHDRQEVWPRYAALDARLLDKLELVLAELASRRGNAVQLDVHSGFRTPLHNRRVQRSAQDSRHQYGDAADVAIDANGDGRVTVADSRLVASAVSEQPAEEAT